MDGIYFPLLNRDKTGIVMGPKRIRKRISSNITTMDDITITSSTTVLNLMGIFDHDTTIDSHMKHTSMTAFFHLHHNKKIRHILSQTAVVKLIHIYFVFARLL